MKLREGFGAFGVFLVNLFPRHEVGRHRSLPPFFAGSAPAQRVLAQPPASVPPPAGASASGQDDAKLIRFDLDFPGGRAADLAAAISKATGRHLNLIVPPELATVEIIPITVQSVTVPRLFSAIEQASNRAVPVRVNGQLEYRDATVRFRAEVPLSGETVWSFQTTMPTEAEREVLAGAPRAQTVCRYFQLANYLENYSIEDITTAIQTSWKMAKIDPAPRLSFHPGTRLLIAVGTEVNVNLIPQVLEQLQRDRKSAVEKLTQLQADLDEAQAKNDPAAAEKLRARMNEIARRQRANELIGESARRIRISDRPPQPEPPPAP